MYAHDCHYAFIPFMALRYDRSLIFSHQYVSLKFWKSKKNVLVQQEFQILPWFADNDKHELGTLRQIVLECRRHAGLMPAAAACSRACCTCIWTLPSVYPGRTVCTDSYR